MPSRTTPPDTADALDLLTRAEAADIVHVHPKTLERWIIAGRLPAVRVGHRVLVSRRALAAYIDASTQPATTGPLAGRSL